MSEQSESAEFGIYLDGFIRYAKWRNLLFGKPIKPQAEWNALSDAEKETEVAKAIASLSDRQMAIFMHTAHEAIVEELQRRSF